MLLAWRPPSGSSHSVFAAPIALDGDADRLIAVDEFGEVVDGDHIIAICAEDLRERGLLRNNTVVVTVMANLGFKLAMDAAGIDRAHLVGMSMGGMIAQHVAIEQDQSIVRQRINNQRSEVISGLDQGKIPESKELQARCHQALSRPLMVIPAWQPYCLLIVMSTEVRASAAAELLIIPAWNPRIPAASTSLITDGHSTAGTRA